MNDLRGMLFGQLKQLRPAFLAKKPHFNFISIHYFWIIGLSLLGSVIIFGSDRGELAYIDALFFASGACTQAGLNTVDLSNLNTFQQVVIYLLAMLANPITVNSFVVFLRLYWFERRFQHIVREARRTRGTISKSKSRMKPDASDVEKGVNGRSITVMHNGNKSRITNDGMLLDPSNTQAKTGSDSKNENGGATSDTVEQQELRRPEIKFAHTVKRSDGLQEEAVKFSRPDEEHIAIVERQRKGDDEVLRIPGPRDAERGMRPKRVEQTDDEDAEPPAPRINLNGVARSQTVDARQRQNITIEEPDRQKLQESPSEELVDNAKAALNTLSLFSLRLPHFLSRSKHHDEGELEAAQTTQSRRPERARRASFSTIRAALSRDKTEGTPYLSWEPTLGRNSAFPDLTEEQREELGGIEYRSLKALAVVLTSYFWGYSIFGIICLLPWILRTSYWGDIVANVPQSTTWWGFFTANSAFMDLGYTLTPDSMNSFNTAVFPLLVMCFLIIIGNTGFPVMLRFMIWLMSIIVPRDTGLYEELRFLLDHPRRCFTLLFPSAATWWLFAILLILNGLDVMFFIVLDLGTGPVTQLPPGIKVLNGLFEAASTRTAGFSCIDLSKLHPGVQVSYMIMMYISVFPIAISVRRTNVYEEQSLGIYTSGDHNDEPGNSDTDLSYVGAHLRRQLSFDLWYIFVAYFILCISEGSHLMNETDQSNGFTMFSVLFEIVSAYGTVGMSLGYKGVNASLSSQFSVVGKLVIIACMQRGRARGLPYALDRAIILPSESQFAKEAEDANTRMARQNSHISASRSSIRRMSASNLGLTALLHPGPPRVHVETDHHHRRKSAASHSNDHLSPFASRVHHRRPESTYSNHNQENGGD
ncbi:cation transport protein-domain-containing protein [Bombardia bombarda]|uniref:Potassium transport protein n=1 Tax=Bombardia bombarda TaxID=252184 RepID=A0AA40C0S4_9PEZI|nr:cation transport protein-domain-containing protein [Bombardia bombarda]